MLKDILKNKKCFKLICGAGNKDLTEIEKLVALYAKAGANLFDLAADEEVVNAALRGIKRVIPQNELKNYHLCISVGTKDDLHVRKASIDVLKCVSCGKCKQTCINNAVLENNSYSINDMRCIGCGNCQQICKTNAISLKSQSKPLEEILPSLVKSGIDCVELHASGSNLEELYDKWKKINNNFDGIISLCISRANLGNIQLIDLLKHLLQDRRDFTTIIQADGNPMSGSDDKYKTTLQTVAMAEVIQNENLPVFILLSGGTNSKTSELAKICEINIHGIAMGSFARNIVRDFIDREDFLENKEIFNKAVETAQNLINKTLL